MAVAVSTLTLAEGEAMVEAIFRTRLSGPERRAWYRANARRLTWLYGIQQGDNGPIKIGLAKNPDERLKTLQTGNPTPLRGLGAWRTVPEDENRMHALFAGARIAGEWFRPVSVLIELLDCFGASYCWEGEECL